MTLREQVIRLAASKPEGQERTALLGVLAVDKIQGVSETRLQGIIDTVKAGIVTSATDAYVGANWTAEWRITAGEPDTTDSGEPGINVTDAKFVSASGGTVDPVTTELGTFRASDGVLRALAQVGPVVAKAVSGTWGAMAHFGWKEGTESAWFYGAKAVGDVFSSESDAFYRWGVKSTGNAVKGVHVVEVPVKMKVRASWVAREGVLKFSATFKA